LAIFCYLTTKSDGGMIVELFYMVASVIWIIFVIFCASVCFVGFCVFAAFVCVSYYLVVTALWWVPPLGIILILYFLLKRRDQTPKNKQKDGKSPSFLKMFDWEI